MLTQGWPGEVSTCDKVHLLTIKLTITFGFLEAQSIWQKFRAKLKKLQIYNQYSI